MNMLANHGFIARDGITNFVEAVDACQNVFNMHWDLAVVITLIATVLGDGDAITQKFSIGCDATSRTAAVDLNLLTGSQPGLNGHGNFEVDGSMSRNDYFISEGDVFTRTCAAASSARHIACRSTRADHSQNASSSISTRTGDDPETVGAS